MSDDQSRPSGIGKCAGCGAPKTADQRYCLSCGTRITPLPPVLANLLERVRPRPKVEQRAEAEESAAASHMPTPQAAAVAVMALLAFGVIVGSLTQQLAQSAGITTVLLAEPAPAPAAAPEEGAEEVEYASSAPEAPPPETVGAQLLEVPEEGGGEAPPREAPPELPPEATLPPITHVFLIVLGDGGYEDTFGPGSQSAYFSKTLPAQGELLPNYYAVAGGGLANEIALVSGQGPTAETAANCPQYTDIAPGTVSVDAEQVEGNGCLYPAGTPTLPGQLVERKLSWKAYVEDIGNGPPGEATSCRHPGLGETDDAGSPRPGDAYETWRNPFVYFHSILDGPECAERDVGLDQLAPDLQTEDRTPSLSYIVPNACHDGGETACVEGEPAGLAATQPFLEEVVPQIEASDAYEKGGLIAITFAQAPQTGPHADSSACCDPPEFPNLPAAPTPGTTNGPVKPSGGGGRVGLLLISPYVMPGSVDETGYFNHFSLLQSIENLFGLQHLGYAADPALGAFEETVFNAQS